MEPKVHLATVLTSPRPCPRMPHTGRYRKPMRRSGKIRDSACTMIDKVADPARIAIISGVQSAGAADVGNPARWNQTSPPMATMLASAGAHM